MRGLLCQGMVSRLLALGAMLAGVPAAEVAGEPAASAPDPWAHPDEFRIKREAVYEFVRKPEISRNGDEVTITFESRGYCDVTVAIENRNGRILRHLASGVLGPNAPEPFRKNAKRQTLTWDSKDDQGRYVDDKANTVVRVSLGLKPQFERTLLWTPYKRISQATRPVIKACPEGVLLYEGQIYDSVRLFDHEGNYVRTIYPFPANKVTEIEDLHWKVFPQDGARLPLKEWFRQATLLTSGDNSNHPGKGRGWIGFGTQRWYHDGHGAGAQHRAASTMAVRGDRLALAMYWINRLAMDGSSGGLKLNGPKIDYEAIKGGRGWYGGNKKTPVPPHSAVFSPDGKSLYMTGYGWEANYGTGGRWWHWLPGVTRIAYDAEEGVRPELFAGSMKKGDNGKDDARFFAPTSVDVDAKGRVYVSDYGNDRVQVFLPDKTLYKTIAVQRPARVVVHRENGEIYVFSWPVSVHELGRDNGKLKPRLTRFGPLENPRKIATYALPTPSGIGSVEVDSWADEPTIWLYTGHRMIFNNTGYKGHRGSYWQANGIQLCKLEGDRLVVKRDLGKEALAVVPNTRRVTGTGRNLAVNHKTGELYVGDGSAAIGFSWSLATRINPENGKPTLVHLPMDIEQWAFDLNGQAYLRAKDKIVRYDPASWREIPWDYGEEHKDVGVASTRATGPGMKRAPRILAALTTPYLQHAPNGVFNVSPQGHIVVPIKAKQVESSGLVFRKGQEVQVSQDEPYQFNVYPGRSVGGLVQIFDKDGKQIHDDAVPGLTFTHGIKIDKDDNLYALAMQDRMLGGKPYFNAATCTLIKFKPGKARIVGTHKKAIPVPLKEKPKRPPDLRGGGKSGLSVAWVEGAEWFYGGVGYTGEHYMNPAYGCDCCYSSFDLDYFARSFAPEVGHSSVAVLDSGGNLILRIGKYGNVDDGVPLVREGGPADPRSIGGDEVALFYAPHLAVHSDRRLFLADLGNERIVSVKLGYHVEEKVSLGTMGATE